MLNNLRFATAVHIMALLEILPEEWLSSDFIASSIQVNAAIVRKEISSLKKADLVISKEGKGGGIKLAKREFEINLADILKSTQQESLGKFNHPNPNCSVGISINSKLKELYHQVDESVFNTLKEITLKEFSINFK